MIWNAESRLQAASCTLQAAIYKYYDDGYLAERIQGSDMVKYINDGMHCIAKYNGSGSLIEEFVYGANIDEVLCKISASGNFSYYHQDALESVVAITDESSAIAASYQYDVFGKERLQSGTLSNEILFTGRWLDSVTGLYNYRARWYDGRTGRFLSRDPIGVEDDINLYRYVKSNSINLNDPLGKNGDLHCEQEYANCKSGVRNEFKNCISPSLMPFSDFTICMTGCGATCLLLSTLVPELAPVCLQRCLSLCSWGVATKTFWELSKCAERALKGANDCRGEYEKCLKCEKEKK